MDATGERRHVLLVDDEPATHRLVAAALRDEPVRLTCVGDGARALHLLEQARVDLLILPLTMPLMDGVETLRHVANRGLDVRVIVTSAVDPPRASRRSRLGFLREPVRPEPLVAGVRERMNGASAAELVGPPELATLIAMERRSCALHVRGDGVQGVLLFAGGVPVDAAVADLRGNPAARELLACRRAVLRVDSHVRAREFTISSDLATLLRDAEATRTLRSSVVPTAPSTMRPTTPPGPAASEPPRPAGSTAPPVAAAVVVTPTTAAPPARVAAAATIASTVATPATTIPASTVATPAEPASVPAWERPQAQGPIAALIADALAIDGALGAALAVWELDHSLASAAAGDRLGAAGMQAAVSGNARVMRATMSTLTRLGLRSTVEDVLITLDEQLHVLSPLPRHDGLFLHLVLDRQRSNLALARLRVQRLLAGFSLA